MTSWPSRSSNCAIQLEWLPASITTRKRFCFEKYLVSAEALVRIEQLSDSVPLSSSRVIQLFLSPRSSPTTASMERLSAITVCWISWRMVVSFMAALSFLI